MCQQPAFERRRLTEVHLWQMSRTTLSIPHLLSPDSSSPFLVCLPLCLWAKRTQSPFKTAKGKNIWRCCIKATALPLWYNGVIGLKKQHVTLYICNTCLFTTGIVGAQTFVSFSVTIMNCYAYGELNFHEKLKKICLSQEAVYKLCLYVCLWEGAQKADLHGCCFASLTVCVYI